jgi:hypothetical protein
MAENSTQRDAPLAAPSNVPQNLTLQDKHARLIARVDNRIRTRASRILADTFLAADVDEFSPRPEGWTDRQYRTAMDARKCAKEAPVYLQTAAKILDSFKRSEATRPPANPEIHADVRVYVRQDVTVNYRTVELTDD